MVLEYLLANMASQSSMQSLAFVLVLLLFLEYICQLR